MELISIIIGLSGFLFGIYAYYKNREVSELTIVYSNELIEGKQKSGVEMLYLGEPVSDFIRYDITLFNSGRGTLKPEDFKGAITFDFDSLQVVSQTPIFSTEDANPDYQVNEKNISVNFEKLKQNDHISFETLTGGHGVILKPPVVNAELRRGKSLKIYQQRFEKEPSNEKYQRFLKYLCLVGGVTSVGLLLFFISAYEKYKVLLEKGVTGFREQLNILLSINSLLWFSVFLISLVLLIFAYQSLKFLGPKFRRCKFEQLIQNKH